MPVIKKNNKDLIDNNVIQIQKLKEDLILCNVMSRNHFVFSLTSLKALE